MLTLHPNWWYDLIFYSWVAKHDGTTSSFPVINQKKRPKSTTKHVRTSSHNRTFRGISKILQCGFIPKRVSLQTILSLREKRYIIHLDNYTIPKDNFFPKKINFNKTLLLDIFEFLRPNWKIFLNISVIKVSKVFIFDVF